MIRKAQFSILIEETWFNPDISTSNQDYWSAFGGNFSEL